MSASAPNPRHGLLVAALASWGLVASVASVASAGPAGARVARPARIAVPAQVAPDDPRVYRPPVMAPVVDPFRPPAQPWLPGNRGLEYAVVPGSLVRAIGPGVVVFAGPVAGSLHVTILHPDGLRSSYSYLAAIRVGVGDRLAGGDVVGVAAAVLHLGVRRGEQYLDPASLWGQRVSGGSVSLVPLDGGSGPGGGRGRARLTPFADRRSNGPVGPGTGASGHRLGRRRPRSGDRADRCGDRPCSRRDRPPGGGRRAPGPGSPSRRPPRAVGALGRAGAPSLHSFVGPPAR